MNLHFVSQFFVALVALIHINAFILESYLWLKPRGRKAFNTTDLEAETSAVLAANQGVYNLFLALGLLASFFFKNSEITLSFQMFFLSCVFLAGVYGAMTTGPQVGPRIFKIQSIPALIGLLLVIFTS